MKDCSAMGSSALKMLLGTGGRTGSQGSWNPAESAKDGAAHPLQARRHGIYYKRSFLLCIEHFVCYCTYIPLLLFVFIFCSFSVPIQCPETSHNF